jgi:hypothetical protein
MAQDAPEVAYLPRGDVGLGEEIGPQQVGEGSGVDLVVLEPGRRDCLAALGVGEVGIEAEVVEQLGHPPPPVGGLERHRGARLEGGEQRRQLAGVVGDVAVGDLFSRVVQDRHLGPLAVHVQSDVNHCYGPPLLELVET